MGSTVRFRFYSRLNDFLSTDKVNTEILFSFNLLPSVKDAIEAMGVPHPEVGRILVNGCPVNFKYHLKSEDKIDVFPVVLHDAYADTSSQIRFVLDVHLGKLAKALRMLGFDTLYKNDYTDKEIAAIASHDQRIVLTRDVGLLMHRIIKYGYWLRSQHLDEQLIEVIGHFKLKDKFKPLSRCLLCNTEIAPVEKKEIENLLAPKTRSYYHDFYQCPACMRVYWKGSHYERMTEFVNGLSSCDVPDISDKFK